MKRISALLIALLLFLCACGKEGAKSSKFKLEETKTKVSFAEGKTAISGDLIFYSPQKITLKLSKPKELEACVFKLENGVLSFGFEETQCNLENLENIFGGGKGFQTLFELLSAAGESERSVSAGKVKLTCALGEAVLSLDEKNQMKALRAGVYDYEFTPSQDKA